jgi:hypothetical protein
LHRPHESRGEELSNGQLLERIALRDEEAGHAVLNPAELNRVTL